MNTRELERLRLKIIAIDAYHDKHKKRRKVCRNKSRCLKKDILFCEECWSDSQLQVHHIDKDSKNNKIENLQKLCLSCHITKHEWEPICNLMKKMLK